MGAEARMDAIALFQNRHPDCATEIVEVPFSDPFGPVYRGEVDTAVVLMPVEENELVLGQVFSRQPQTLALSSRHPFAKRDSLSAEDLASCPLISVHGAAPEYWRRAHAPSITPERRAIPAGPTVSTLQEGLALVQADRGAMLLCYLTKPSAHAPSRMLSQPLRTSRPTALRPLDRTDGIQPGRAANRPEKGRSRAGVTGTRPRRS
ncbi:substrate-binding domain-containing protein [Streptomyces sp. NPDC002911]